MSTFYIKRNDNDLVHYGILGMKWGIRRYQNPDGSYTAAGMKRYDIKNVRPSNNIFDNRQKRAQDTLKRLNEKTQQAMSFQKNIDIDMANLEKLSRSFSKNDRETYENVKKGIFTKSFENYKADSILESLEYSRYELERYVKELDVLDKEWDELIK